MTEADLTTELRRRAERTANAMMEAARADAERIIAEADALVEARRRAAVENTEKSVYDESRSHIAAARHESLRAILVARAELLERVMEQAQTLLSDACSGESYRSSLAGEVAQALEFLGSGDAVIQCSEDLTPDIRNAISTTSSARVEVLRDGRHGFVAVGREGRVLVDGTLESRLQRLAPTLDIELTTRIKESRS